jgi:hypothetical protein
VHLVGFIVRNSCPHFTTRKNVYTLKLLYTLSKTSLRVCHHLQIMILLESSWILFSTCVHYSYSSGKFKHTGLVTPHRNYFCPITSILSKVPWSTTHKQKTGGLKSHVTVVVTGEKKDSLESAIVILKIYLKTHLISSSMLTYNRCGFNFLPCKAASDNIIYRYK